MESGLSQYIGKRVKFKGKWREVVGTDTQDRLILWVREEGIATSVPFSAISLMAADKFNIGDKVCRPGHLFVGRVVAFEDAGERAICISLSDNPQGGDRARWSYAADELQLFEIPRLQLNEEYFVESYDGIVHHVRALEHPAREMSDKVLLYSVSTGRRYKTLPVDLDFHILSRNGIKSIRLVSRKEGDPDGGKY